MTGHAEALAVADWRRRVFALYADVRSVTAEQSAGTAHAHWRTGRDRLFAEHPASPWPEPSTFRGLAVADYDPDWRFELAVEPAEPATVVTGTGTDGDVSFSRVGTVTVPAVGTLDVWWHDGYGGGLFLPVRDASAGPVTYGGGRYLLDTTKGADLGLDPVGDRLVLDFNFAYNPSCVYDPAWACPLPQPGNTVPVAVPVGELLPVPGPGGDELAGT